MFSRTERLVPLSQDKNYSVKVRISLKTALGGAAYEWNANEMFLFTSTIAYAMRQYFSEKKNETVAFQAKDVHVGEETQRISFIFAVTMPDTTDLVPKSEVEAAIRLSRGRINEVFMLNDQTLEFIDILPTLAPPYEPPVTVWLIVFGVVLGIVAIALVALIITGQRDRRR
ncbi:hypothetical protein lerEdw1_016686 [Lerista edwardsae]|nr:hypothetical protein lerEdw1_016686 [Lerista edwardsae]